MGIGAAISGSEYKNSQLPQYAAILLILRLYLDAPVLNQIGSTDEKPNFKLS